LVFSYLIDSNQRWNSSRFGAPVMFLSESFLEVALMTVSDGMLYPPARGKIFGRRAMHGALLGSLI
jgi:hypothetical protein